MCTPTGVGTACLGTGLCGCTEDADCAADRMCDRALNRCVERPIVDAGTDAGRDAGDDVMVAEAGADAGASTDTGVSKDAGANDAGKDVAMAFDAPTADASGNALSGGSGCGCAVLGSRAGGGAWSLLALAAVLFVRRRRALT
jgi:MYXO-CTERM domain-containing protein